ncbi:MAG: hypothetical protein ABEJ75_03370 [Candidatus Nanohaloarchaea archaeon]
MGEEDNYWIIEIYNDETANVSITSEEEVDALKNMGEIEDWMVEPTSEATEEEMIERAEDRGYEHDPW